MNRLIPFTVLLWSVTANAQIISVELLQSFTIENVYAEMDDLGVPPGFLPVNYAVDFYRVEYTTIHPNGSPVTVSGAVCVPVSEGCSFPLSSYQHGTIARRTDAPSFLSTEGMICVLYASAGYVSIAADYIGLGTSPGMHLYVHADSEASTCIDLLHATVELQEQLNYTLNDELFIWGYSQGGHATAALQRALETDAESPFTLTGSAPMSGPYDVSGVQAAVITGNDPYPTPGYLPYVVFSYQEAYGGILYNDISEVFVAPYDELLPGLFDGNTSMGTINNQCPDVPSQMLQPALLELFQNDPQHPMRVALADNDLLDWAPQAPTRLLYCNADDQVNYMNSEVAYDAYIALGSTSVESIDLGAYDHGFCAPFAMFDGFQFFESLRLAPFNPTVNETITASNGTDGIINVDVFAPGQWTHEWAHGEMNLSAFGLAPGTYYLTITSEEGCSVGFMYEVPEAVGVGELSAGGLSVWPNPAEDQLRVKYTARTQAELLDQSGRIVLQLQLLPETLIDLSLLESGVYMLRTIDGEVVRVVKR